MSKKEKRIVIKIAISIIMLAIINIFKFDEIYKDIGYIITYLIVGFSVLRKAIKNIINGQVFDENFLMSIATIGAIALKEFPEGVMVMLLYQVGELFESYAVGKSRKEIYSLMDIRPDYANIEKQGDLIQVSPEDVKVNDLIIVKPGEKIPLDGIVVKGNGLIDTSKLTGETIPRNVETESEVISGCINLDDMLTIKVTKEFGESTVSKILDLVQNASTKKAKTENFITKFSRYYTPVVVILAILLTFVPTVVFNNGTILEWLQRALTFLVISCPCALVISVPLGFFGGIGGASKRGILIKGSNYMEALSKVQTVVFDKTGTLTKGNFEVTRIYPVGVDKDYLLEIATICESYSNHPISISIKKAFGKEIDNSRISKVKEIAGNGVEAIIDGKTTYVGNERLMSKINIEVPNIEEIGTIIYVAQENKYLGSILISDTIKENSKEAICKLKKESKIKEIVMLTGDYKKVADRIGSELQIDKIYSELLPTDKVENVEELMEQNEGKLAFVGDGINDAPVLKRVDVGIAMGVIGSDAAIESADVVIMDDNISKINMAIKISKRTLKIVKQNIIFALTVKFVFLILGALGLTNMFGAVFADVGVSVIAILNSMRTL